MNSADLYWNNLSVLLGGVATLAIFSFLIGENRFYRFFEHLFIGIAAGLTPVLVVRDFLWPQIIEPIFALDIVTYPDGTRSQQYNKLNLFYLAPLLFGTLYYTIYSKRYNWMAKLVIGFTLGASGALAIRGFFSEVIPQIISSCKPFLVFSQSGELLFWEGLNNFIFVVILLLVLNYFLFTFGRPGSLQERGAKLGRPLLMVCFGAFFGSTVMARLALLVERVQFIGRDWISAVLGIR
jgi:hypothetical protein